MKEKIVIPGEFLGTFEEFTPGSGVYDEKGDIYASVIGEVRINRKRIIEVIPRVENFSTLKEGNLVIGRIEDIKDTVVVVNIAGVKGKEKYGVPLSNQAVIHISNIKNGFVSELQHEFGILDIIKAKVIDAKALRLSTEAKNLGVIKAVCSRCKGDMKRKGNVLVCEKCKRTEIRKISNDYGESIWL